MAQTRLGPELPPQQYRTPPGFVPDAGSPRRAPPGFIPDSPNLLSFLNRGIARGLTFGIGADTIIAGMNSLGVGAATRESETLEGRIAEGTGLALGTLPGLLVPLTRVAGLGGKLGMFAKSMTQPFISTPVRSIAIEAAAGAGSGAGLHAAKEQFPESVPAQVLGEAAGGIAGGMGAALYTVPARLAKTSLKRAIDIAKSTIFPFTREAAKPRAAAQLQQRVADPLEIAAASQRETIGGLSPIQATGDDNLIALERAIKARDPGQWKTYQKQLEQSEIALREAAAELADPAGLETHVNNAISKADAILGFGAPTMLPTKATARYAKVLQDSLQQAKALEARAWNIPNVRVLTTNLRTRFDELLGRLPKAQAGDMPTEANQLLRRRPREPGDALLLGPDGEVLVTRESAETGIFGNTESVKELHGFYSKMRETARNARAGDTPNYNKARLAEELADAVWVDLTGGADQPTAVGEALNIAREYSRELNRVFRQGAVGRLLGYERTGARRAMPEEMLEVALGSRGGAQQAITVDELQQAATFGGREGRASAEAIVDYLKQRFLDAANPLGSFNPNNAKMFLIRNRDLLTRFPEIETQFQNSIQAMQSADTLQKLRPAVTQALKSANPKESMRGILSGVTRDEWRAVQGGLLEQSLYTGSADPLGQPEMSGVKLLSMVKAQRTRPVFQEAFGDAGVDRLTKIADELAKLQRAQGAIHPTIPGSEMLEPKSYGYMERAASYMAGTIGARLGAWFGGRTSGASLRTASRMARMSEEAFTDFLNKHTTELLTDAANDHKLFSSLMVLRLQPQNQTAQQVFGKWVGNLAADAGQAAISSFAPVAMGTAGVTATRGIGVLGPGETVQLGPEAARGRLQPEPPPR